MTTDALRLRHAAPPLPRLRWVLFTGSAAAFFVLAYSSAVTWSDVQAAQHQGFGRELAALTRGAAAGNPTRQAAGVVLGALGVLAFVAGRGRTEVRARGALGWVLIAYLALLAVSVGWADDPQLTARRAVAFGLMTLAVAGFVRALPADAIVSYALFGSAAFVVVSALAELATGAFRPWAADYRFSGVFHPNTVASFCVVFVVAATCVRGRAHRGLLVLGVALAIAVLLLTRSRSSVSALAVVLALRWILTATPARATFALAAAAWIGCSAVFLFGDAVGPAVRDTVLMSRADSEAGTLSGRTALWDQLLRFAAERPALGYGIGGFWSPRRVQAVYAAQRWPAADSHSTYIEQLLDLGVVGLGLFLFILLAAGARAARAARARGGPAAAFMLCMITYYVLAGLVETLQPAPSFITFVMMWVVGFLSFRSTADVVGETRCAST
jgi:exopolysaccharide production protein ExoQ